MVCAAFPLRKVYVQVTLLIHLLQVLLQLKLVILKHLSRGPFAHMLCRFSGALNRLFVRVLPCRRLNLSPRPLIKLRDLPALSECVVRIQRVMAIAWGLLCLQHLSSLQVRHRAHFNDYEACPCWQNGRPAFCTLHAVFQ